MTDELIKNIKSDFRKYLYEESCHRVEKCLNYLNPEELWHKPNENSNSMGVIVVQLMGNITQYIISALGQEEDTRQRDTEFEQKPELDSHQLTQSFRDVVLKACRVVEGLSGEQINRKYSVQGFEMTGLSIITHVIEHCSYHVGQITYFTKLVKDIDMAYYGDLDLNQLNE